MHTRFASHGPAKSDVTYLVNQEHSSQGSGPTGIPIFANSIRDTPEAFSLFGKTWKPGFLTDETHVIAVKCKHIIWGEENGQPRQNTFDGTLLHMFSDGKPSTAQCLERSKKSAHPVRVALWENVKNEYHDYGWAIVEGKDEYGKYVFRLDAQVRTNFASQPYPTPDFANGSSACSLRTEYSGYVYESKLEATVAALFDIIGFNYEAQPRAFATSLEQEWRTDFLIRNDNNEEMYYVEVKPTYPHLSEQQRCACAAWQTNVPFVLLYGKVAPPFPQESTSPSPWAHTFKRERSSQTADREYERFAHGLLGIMWKIEDGCKLVRREVVLKSERLNNMRIEFGEINHVGEDYSWATPLLIKAYTSAHAKIQAGNAK